MADLKPLARSLRKNATRAERLLWSRLRRNSVEGFYFRRQVPVFDYIADFACFEAKLIVEVDGATHSSPSELADDARRDARFEARGFMVLRIVNDDVYKNLDGGLETIRLKLRELRRRV